MELNYQKELLAQKLFKKSHTTSMLTFNVPFHWRQMNALIRFNVCQSHTSVNCRKGFYEFRASGNFFLSFPRYSSNLSRYPSFSSFIDLNHTSSLLGGNVTRISVDFLLFHSIIACHFNLLQITFFQTRGSW